MKWWFLFFMHIFSDTLVRYSFSPLSSFTGVMDLFSYAVPPCSVSPLPNILVCWRADGAAVVQSCDILTLGPVFFIPILLWIKLHLFQGTWYIRDARRRASSLLPFDDSPGPVWSIGIIMNQNREQGSKLEKVRPFITFKRERFSLFPVH